MMGITIKPRDRVVHRLYGRGELRFVHPGAPGKNPAHGHVKFDDDRCGRRVLLADLERAPAHFPVAQEMEMRP